MKISPPVAERIRTAETAVAAAEGALQTAEAALASKQAQCRSDVEEVERLKQTLEPGDQRGIEKLLTLRAKLEFYDKPIAKLADAVARARAALDGRKGQVCDALAEAGKEIDVERTKIARAALSSVTDTAEWIEKTLPGLSSVWETRRFVELCGQGTVERDFGLPLAKVAALLLAGQLPAIPRPDPREREIILASVIPDATLRR
jgi:hypothetical protein